MPENEMPLGGDLDTYVAQTFAEFNFVTVGTAAPTTYTTPIVYNSAGTSTYVWNGTAYTKVKAMA